MINLEETFRKFDDDYIKFEQVVSPLHVRPDLCAFLLLDKLVPRPGRKMVAGAEHDEIYLDTDCDALAEVATEEDILTLTRCGVRYDSEVDSLALFV